MLGAGARVKVCRPVRRATPRHNRLADSSETRCPHGGHVRDKRGDGSNVDEETAAHAHAAQQESLLGSRVKDCAAR